MIPENSSNEGVEIYIISCFGLLFDACRRVQKHCGLVEMHLEGAVF